MRIQNAIPDFGKIALKRGAYLLYQLSQKTFQGPFSVYDFQTIMILKKALDRKSNCVDVGANVGHILKEIIDAAPDGQHMAFEPIPRLCQKLQGKYGKRVEIYNCALSNQSGEQDFYYFEDSPALSGLRERKSLGNHSVVPIKVPTMKLDNVWPYDRPIDLIKIDVEGAELSVLQGALDTLRRNRPTVLFEWGLGGADEFGATPEELFDLLMECGLSLSLMEYWLQGKKPFEKQEFCGQFYKHYNYFFIAYDPAKHRR